MGATNSRVADTKKVNDLTKHYSDLVESMMHNQLTFDTSTRNIAAREREWFASFENYLADNNINDALASEDSLYKNISMFVRQSQEDIGGILDGISDPALKSSARDVMVKTKNAVVLQKYYEYKYLHLSAVFVHFTEFVQKLIGIMSDSVLEATSTHVEATNDDLTELLNAVSRTGMTKKDLDIVKKSVRNVHNASSERLETLSEQLNAISQASSKHVEEFPMKQFEEQRMQENDAYPDAAEELNPDNNADDEYPDTAYDPAYDQVNDPAYDQVNDPGYTPPYKPSNPDSIDLSYPDPDTSDAGRPRSNRLGGRGRGKTGGRAGKQKSQTQ